MVLGRAATRWLTAGSLLVMAAVMVSSVLFGDLSLSPPSPLLAALYAGLSPALWAAALGCLVLSTTFGQASEYLSATSDAIAGHLSPSLSTTATACVLLLISFASSNDPKRGVLEKYKKPLMRLFL